jgi:hypothetical protein
MCSRNCCNTHHHVLWENTVWSSVSNYWTWVSGTAALERDGWRLIGKKIFIDHALLLYYFRSGRTHFFGPGGRTYSTGREYRTVQYCTTTVSQVLRRIATNSAVQYCTYWLQYCIHMIERSYPTNSSTQQYLTQCIRTYKYISTFSVCILFLATDATKNSVCIVVVVAYTSLVQQCRCLGPVIK